MSENADQRCKVGDIIEVEIVDPGGTGVFIARHNGQVVFVRHAIPGELVRAEITNVTKNYMRADTVEIIRASQHRVEPPCAVAGVCGGCDYQHIEISQQRAIKGELLRSVLAHLGKVLSIGNKDLSEIEVEPLEDESGLRWRTRTRYAVTPTGEVGFRMARSHSIVEVEDCLTSLEGSTQLAIANSSRSIKGELVVAGSSMQQQVVVDKQNGPWLTEVVGNRSWRIHAGNFWQAHKNAPAKYVEVVLEFGGFTGTEIVLDLYSGSALFAASIAEQVEQVVAVESSIDAVRNARRSCSDLANLDLVTETAEYFIESNSEIFDVVVLDPPRAGAGQQLIAQIAKIAKSKIIYVACEPSALARDTAILQENGWRLTKLRAFDAFPMTAHFECIALFEPASFA